MASMTLNLLKTKVVSISPYEIKWKKEREILRFL